METLNASAEEELYHFLKEHGNNRMKRQLLAFLGRHPNAKFSRRVICCALDCSKLEAEGALRAMVEEGLLDEHTNNSVTLYSLTKNEGKSRLVLELASLSWEQRQLMLRRIEHKDKLVKEKPCKDE